MFNFRNGLIASTIAALSIKGASAARKCDDLVVPTFESFPMSDSFAPSKVSGLWFEYVWSPTWQDGLEYDCSMWTVLKDTSEHEFTVFNHLNYPEEEKSGDYK